MNLPRLSFVFLLLVLIFIKASESLAQTESVPREAYPPAIEDNSFLIEEAYNQEPRVVQHISSFIFDMGSDRDVEYDFTQEWPLGSQQHQLSYTLPIALAGNTHGAGVGNVLLNYRYQLLEPSSWMACAPRISLVIPTTVQDFHPELGTPGLQVNVAASKRLSLAWVTHANLGMTWLPRVRQVLFSGSTKTESLTSYNAGVSFVFLLAQQHNVMLECVFNRVNDLDTSGDLLRSNQWTVNPGYRHAIDIGNLQIVPGIAVPITFRPDETTAAIFIYLSFEHPF